MRILTILFSLGLFANPALTQTDEEYTKFTDGLKKTYKLSDEETEKLTSALKEARKEFAEIVSRLKDVVDDEKKFKLIKNSLISLNDKTIKYYGLSDDKNDKVLGLAKEAQEKLKEHKDKLKAAAPEKAKQFEYSLYGWIIIEKLTAPIKTDSRTPEEKTEDIVSEMKIEDKDKKDNVIGILKNISKLKQEKWKAMSESKNLLYKLYKEDISDQECEKLIEILKTTREKESEIIKLEEELLSLLTVKQYLVYLKKGINELFYRRP